MRIVIDMQGAQTTGSRNRGIGRYTRSIALAMARNRGDHEIVLALNGSFPETIETIRTAFDGLILQKDIRVWNAVPPMARTDDSNYWRRKSGELVREAFLANLQPDIVYVSSIFEGLIDDAVTSIGELSRGYLTAVTLYDLIPYIYRRPYLENPVVEAWYLEKLEHLRRADLWLAISESSRQEGLKYLELPEGRSINVSTDADSYFRKTSISSKDEHDIREKYGLRRAFVMYTGGIDYRKNIEGLIRAYAKLPWQLRDFHQLAIVCSVQAESRHRLRQLAAAHGLDEVEIVLTDFVPEEDLRVLYNLCALFVFPSWHEGFGLPALEAIRCGAPVIGANTSSLPEVIGSSEAMFDPHSDEAIAQVMTCALTDDTFRARILADQKARSDQFSWDESARRAIAAMERAMSEFNVARQPVRSEKPRPRLAFVSPLPPERSGIADFGAELLPRLARYYDIDVIVDQDEVATPWIKQNCRQRTVEWFVKNAGRYDRVMYQLGNSSYHQHMFSLLGRVPGVVVLHDFFLSGIAAHMECHGIQPGIWTQSLYDAHGYAAVRHRFATTDSAETVWKFPCNLPFLQGAQGVIVHSEYSRQLAKKWYGEYAGHDWQIVPLLRVPIEVCDEITLNARAALGLAPDQFVVCSFGLIGRTKLNHRLLNAWLNSPLARDARCMLAFVGENEAGEYGMALTKAISDRGLNNRIRITGWVDRLQFEQYLLAANVGVQLRTLSRGETSAAVLDCMNVGLPTIVNANGSMAELPEDGVWKLPDDFSDDQLVEALAVLYHDADKRSALGARAREVIREQHAPDACAGRYAEAIEKFHQASRGHASALISEIAALDAPPPKGVHLCRLADAIDRSIAPLLTQPQVLADVTELVHTNSGIKSHQVVRGILQEWLLNPPLGYRIEPVYREGIEGGYRYAREFTLQLLGCPKHVLQDDPVRYRAGDYFIEMVFERITSLVERECVQAMRQAGVKVQFVPYRALLNGFDGQLQEGSVEGFGDASEPSELRRSAGARALLEGILSLGSDEDQFACITGWSDDARTQASV